MGSMKRKKSNSKVLFYEDKPLFGMDIGHDSIRVIQFETASQKPRLLGYGSVVFDPSAVKDGVIIKPELIAKSAVRLFSHGLIGEISTNRAAVGMTASRIFTRAVQLPKMNSKDIDEAVKTEIEQYLPMAINDLYLDYSIIKEDETGTEVFVEAVGKNIVDSYLVLTRLLGVEAILFDTSIGANARLFSIDEQSDLPSVLVDFGAEYTGITVYNHGLVVTGSIAFGGEDITALIAGALEITPRDAIVFKSKYGLSASKVRKHVVAALEPSLELLIREIRRTIRYYEQRYPKEKSISQIVTMGGGANMPGLADYLTEKLRLPSRTLDMTSHFEFGHLHTIHAAEHMTYVTAAGLALTNPNEVFA